MLFLPGGEHAASLRLIRSWFEKLLKKSMQLRLVEVKILEDLRR